MDKNIAKEIIAALQELEVLSDAKVEKIDGVALLAAELPTSTVLHVRCTFVFHTYTDSLHVEVCWDRAVPCVRRVIDGYAHPSDQSIARSEFKLGSEVDGRARTFHLVEGFAVDERVSIEKLYSSGRGPAYRVQRVPELVSSVNLYLKRLLAQLIEQK